MTFLRIVIRYIFLFEHDLVGKPVPTFPDQSVEAPGRCEPRLNSFPLLIDAMLWGTLSSLRNVSDPPALMVTLSIENIRPCWRIVCMATRPPAARPRGMTRRSVAIFRMERFLG